MAPTHDTAANLLRNASGRVFTLSEALDFMDVLDTMPTGSYPNVRWVNTKTGNEVVIGRCSGGKKDKKEKTKKVVNPFLEVSHKQQFQRLSKIHSRKF